MQAAHHNFQFISLKDSAPLMGLTECQLRGWVSKGVGPKPIRVGGRLYFTYRIIEQYLLDKEAASIPRGVKRAKANTRSNRALSIFEPPVQNVLFQKVRYRGGGRDLQIAQGKESLSSNSKKECSIVKLNRHQTQAPSRKNGG